MPRKRRTPSGAPAQPVAAPTGGAYGSRQALEQSQTAVPIAAATPSGGSGPPAARGPMDAAAEHPAPTNIPLSAPTQRPGEPFSAGLDIGPGPGAGEAPNMFSNPQLPNHLIVSLEALAAMPGASDATRNMVRRLRSRL